MKNIQKDSQVCVFFVEIEGDDLVNTAVWKLHLLFTLAHMAIFSERREP